VEPREREGFRRRGEKGRYGSGEGYMRFFGDIE